MKTLFTTELFMLFITIGIFAIGSHIYTKTKIALLHPLITTIACIVPILYVLEIDYATYFEKTRMIDFMLGPCIVALGYAMHKQIDYIKGNVIAILCAILVGSLVGIVSITIMGVCLDASPEMIVTLEPKSVTTPIALRLSEQYGGNPTLTILVVVIVGISGSIIAPAFLRLIGIKKKMSIGLGTGSCAHGIGTARAMQIGKVEGAASSLAMGIMGLFTSLLMPLIDWLKSMLL